MLVHFIAHCQQGAAQWNTSSLAPAFLGCKLVEGFLCAQPNPCCLILVSGVVRSLPHKE